MRTLLLLLFLGVSVSAVHADEMTSFTVHDTSYQVMLPTDWEVEEHSEGVQLTQKDKKASIAIALLPNPEDVTLSAFQQNLVARLNLSDIKKVEMKNSVELTGEKQNIRYRIRLKDEKKRFVAVVAAGVEKKTFDAVIDSLRDKPDKPEKAEKPEKTEKKDKTDEPQKKKTK